MGRRSGLGKGLSALIPAELAEGKGPGAALAEVPVGSISPSSFQPRRHFEEERLASLTASVRELGVLQPVLVRPGQEPGTYELIAGERRWRAAKRAGLQTVPALVREVGDDASLEQALVENLHRQDLNPLEEAAAFNQLIEDFHLTHEELARRVGKSRAAVTNTLRLFQLPPAIQRLVAEGQLAEGHARALLGSPDRAFQEALAKRAVSDGLSVRAVEEAVRARSRAGEEDAGTGGPGPGSSPRAGRRLRPPGLLELEELLSTHLDTRVKVEMGNKKGRVVVEFGSLEDLERIYRVMTDPRPTPVAALGEAEVERR
ncbi:MAG: ParB/RepB/Spo0J family partition protein [Actinomycetota bacterium]|nr:ParB/RepB/Spo0J family partition protein [Actinomycetota bacterium]